MPRKSQKRNCRRRYQRRVGVVVQLAERAARAHGIGPQPSCRISPHPPSARRPHAVLPRCRPWRRRGGAAGWAARAWSWSGARWTWSASCAPSATRTARWTSATTACEPPAACS